MYAGGLNMIFTIKEDIFPSEFSQHFQVLFVDVKQEIIISVTLKVQS